MRKSQKEDMYPQDWTKTDFHKVLVRFFVMCIGICLLTVGCQKCNQWFGQDDDWWLEEAVEEVIESKTGLNLDLTPASHE